MPKKKLKSLKPIQISDLMSLSLGNALKYVQKLHEHIAKQNKRIGKLKLKITKLVSDLVFRNSVKLTFS